MLTELCPALVVTSPIVLSDLKQMDSLRSRANINSNSSSPTIAPPEHRSLRLFLFTLYPRRYVYAGWLSMFSLNYQHFEVAKSETFAKLLCPVTWTFANSKWNEENRQKCICLEDNWHYSTHFSFLFSTFMIFQKEVNFRKCSNIYLQHKLILQ